MLVLTRKPGEQIIIQGNIRISVVNIGNGRVKLGIDAPADVTIDREEIHTRKVEPMIVEPVEAVTKSGLHNRIKNITPAAKPNKPR
jgi:carbon storage regulator